MNEEQLSFDFFPVDEPSPVTAGDDCSFQILQQGTLRWLLGRDPSGFAFGVPTRLMKYRADLAAFWSAPQKKRLQPEVTMIIEMRLDRDGCWPDCGNRDELLTLLRNTRDRQAELETQIREQEPELMDTDTLFAEFQRWDYARSGNQEYQRCRKQVEKLEHALYRGSRFEQLRRAHVADFHYLAVPRGAIRENELAYGWGLLYVSAAGDVEVVREAMWRDCSIVSRMHLIQNIAATATRDVMFAHGVRIGAKGNLLFSAPPRRRRKVCREYPADE
ncbi:MAG: hypothetical protein PHQ27_00865 [Victivallales bacterium]|nr:hypothetical protein [Victivallales bacterium]